MSDPAHLPDALYADLADHFRAEFEAQLARAPFKYRAEAAVHRVYDGDTWFGTHRPDPTTVIAMARDHRDDGDDQPGQYYRLSGIDTHELNSSDDAEQEMAREERDWVQSWVETGQMDYAERDEHGRWPFVLEYQAKEFEGSFGRPLCDLVRKSDGQRLSDAILRQFPERDIEYHASKDASEQDAVTRALRPSVGVPWAADPAHLP